MAMHHHAQPDLDLGHAVVMQTLWSSMGPDERRAMRTCCTPMRDAVDALVGSLDAPEEAFGKEAPVLSATACARLCSVHTVTLRSMRSLRAMLLPPAADTFPRLKSLRLLLEEEVGHAT
jgi:hypothetical protein